MDLPSAVLISGGTSSLPACLLGVPLSYLCVTVVPKNCIASSGTAVADWVYPLTFYSLEAQGLESQWLQLRCLSVGEEMAFLTLKFKDFFPYTS